MKKKILGLILELNPFHNGHKYFIEEAKRLVKPDLTVAIITSSFTMRGDISVIDKFEKAKLLATNNVDLVLELPLLYANNSADFFAKSALHILNAVNITHLAFGTEIDSLDNLIKIKNICKSTTYDENIKKYLDLGNSYASSSLKAFMEESSDDYLINNFSLPNNTLALAYLKAIDEVNKEISPVLIKRINNNYYDTKTNDSNIASATAIRELLQQGKDTSNYIFYQYDFIDINKSYSKLYNLLRYCLISKDLSSISGINEGIDNRMQSFYESSNYLNFIENVKTRRYSENRIKRLILNILLDIDKSYENNLDYITYLRPLYANSDGIKILKGKDIITSPTKITKDSPIYNILSFELKATKLYELITNKEIYKQEFMFKVTK